MWAGFISLIKIPLLTLNKIIRYFYFQPLLTTNLWRLFSTDRWKIDLCLVAAFGKFLANLDFLVPLLFEKCVYIFVAYHNESCCKLIFRTTNKQYSLRKVQRLRSWHRCSISPHHVLHTKSTPHGSGCRGGIDIRVYTWVFQLPLKHSRPYYSCGYPRGYKYDFDFFTRAHFCIALLCARCFSIRQ